MKHTTKNTEKAKRKEAYISIRLPLETYHFLLKEAEKEERTMSYLARKYLLKGIAG